MNDERFEELLQELRDESAPTEQVKAARERVWQRLLESRSVACDELRPELADYARGGLSAARRLLIEDHLGRCVACRRALADVKGTGKVIAIPQRPPSHVWKRWAAAAAVVIALLYGVRGAIDTMLAPSGPRATVVAVAGTLYQPNGALVAAGTEIGEGQVVRTAAGSRAVLRLRDGSQLEMNQRTELAVQSARSGDTIRLSRGDVIIDAADQGDRSLRVVTRDSIASVKGTVFAVSSGTAGSLVSVVEGSVEVAHGGSESLLTAGQQVASNPALGEVSVSQAVSWSEEAADYYALLAEFAAIEEQLAQSSVSMRRDARLLSLLPANVTAYFAAPNLDDTIDQAISMVDQRALTSAALGEWWMSESGRETREILEQLRGITSLLGPEIVLVLTGSEEPVPLFLAEVRSGAENQVLQAFAELDEDADEPLPVQVADGVLLASDTHANLALLSAQLGAGAGSPFAGEIAQHYQRGVGWLGAVDVTVFSDLQTSEAELAKLIGLDSMRYLFVEQRSGAAGDESEATLSFDGPRRGMASWLAVPGSIGSAEYVSPQAVAATAGSTRDPREAFDQLIAVLGPGSELMAAIAEMENETGISMRDDVAASLGTDFVFALEGMSVTQPMWIAALEVLNAGALDEAVRRMVQTINDHEQASGAEPGELLDYTEESVNGRAWKVLSTGTSGAQAITWTYDRGYAIVATDRATALRAIATRDAAGSLVRTARFQQQFPSGTDVHNSGFLWIDMARVAEVMAAIGQQPAMIPGSDEPVLVVITGENDRIRWASRTRFTSLLFDMMMLEPGA